jgi:hypothetical protein
MPASHFSLLETLQLGLLPLEQLHALQVTWLRLLPTVQMLAVMTEQLHSLQVALLPSLSLGLALARLPRLWYVLQQSSQPLQWP